MARCWSKVYPRTDGANPCCRIDDIIHFRREFSIVDLIRSGNVYGSYLIKTRSQAGFSPRMTSESSKG